MYIYMYVHQSDVYVQDYTAVQVVHILPHTCIPLPVCACM